MNKSAYLNIQKKLISQNLDTVIKRAEKATDKVKVICAKLKFDADKLEDVYVKESQEVIKLFQEVKNNLSKSANIKIGSSVADAFEKFNEGYVEVFDTKKAYLQNKETKIYESTYKTTTIKASSAIKENIVLSKAEILKTYDNYIASVQKSDIAENLHKK